MTQLLQQEIWKDMIQSRYGFRPINIDLYLFIHISKGKPKTDEKNNIEPSSSTNN